ncbi:hypothetical protein ACGVWS_06685 [Enterobacteriaceae bacterium LUAb1]
MSTDSHQQKINRLPFHYNDNGEMVFSLTSHPRDGSRDRAWIPHPGVIPVIFLPGIMGSNLYSISKKDKKDPVWRLNGSLSMFPWLFRGAKTRKDLLHPARVKVDNRGDIVDAVIPAMPQALCRERGWGEVGAMSYGETLPWLQSHLNDFNHFEQGLRKQMLGEGDAWGQQLTQQEWDNSYRYRYPVYAVGYNWLDTNANSALRLKMRIEQILAEQQAEQVILVTHSMGGLVARYCSEVLGMREKIKGIVHGVMPATGAPAAYRRMKSGTENPGSGFGWLKGWLTSEILGANGEEMSAVFCQSPGPLELLPFKEYGKNIAGYSSTPSQSWLTIRYPGQAQRYPLDDPFYEIYCNTRDWWKLYDPVLMNPEGAEKTSEEKFKSLVEGTVSLFQTNLAEQYHPNTYAFYGNSAAAVTYGTVTWHSDHPSALHMTSSRYLSEQGKNQQRDIAWLTHGRRQTESFTISAMDMPGDGTVPWISGIAPQGKPGVKAIKAFSTDHEGAYKTDKADILSYTLWSVIKIVNTEDKQ